MKLEAQKNMLRSEKSSMAKIQEDMYRIRMEKACMLLLSRWKESNFDRRVEEIESRAEREKQDIVCSLKGMYYQMVQLNDLEEQAVEAARYRGEGHAEGIKRTKERVEKWFREVG